MKNIRMVTAALLLAHGAYSATSRPNILVIVADDHRQDLIGKYHGIVQTPTLDNLCENGIYFRNSYVTTPICAASRASIFTGLTERTHGYTFGEPEVPAKFVATAYPRLLKENGYRTGFVGKYGCKLNGADSTRFDFYDRRGQAINETYDGQSTPQTYYIANTACDFIEDAETNHAGTPWCMSVSFWNPHAHDSDMDNQYYYPPEFESLYEEITLPDARISDDATFSALPEFIRVSKARERWYWRYEGEKFQRMTKRYYRAITGVDKGVQRIRDKLIELDIDDNTVIIYIGDNGYMINERQLAGKWLGWEECLRVPLIIYDPRPEALRGVELDQTALNIDLAPTIAELAGLEIPDMYQGKSLYPLMIGEAPLWRDEFFFEHYFLASGGTLIPRNEGVRTKNWKYVNFVLDHYEQLYDLQNDPGETTNLVDHAAYADTLHYLRNSSRAYGSLYSAWPYEEPAPPSGTRYIDNADSGLVYTGSWSVQDDPADYAGSMSWSPNAGDSVQYTFEGNSVQVIIRKGGSGGICNVYVDNLLVADQIDTYADPAQHQIVIYEGSFTEGIHTVKLEATGLKNAAARNPNIMFDCFQVISTSTEPPPGTDIDADGLYDSWEIFNLETLAHTGTDDVDQDGLSNQEEATAGTHPNNADSVFKLNRVTRADDGAFAFEWDSVEGRTYKVLKTGDVMTGNWISQTNRPGTGAELSFSDPMNIHSNKMFYRIEVTRP